MRIFLLAIAAIASIGAARPAERVVHGSGVLSGSINGVPIRIRFDPATVAVPMVTASVARRAGLKSGLFDFEYQVGPRKIDGKSAVGRIDFGSGPIKRRIGWTDQPYAAGLDGVIGPGMLPEDRIRFQLRAPRPGERIASLPLVGQGGLESKWGERFALVRIGDREVRVQFDPNHRGSVATASAGTQIARVHQGHFTGPAEPVEIAFGIRRPVRPMQLATPLKIGPLTIDSIGVRTADFGTSGSIPEAARSDDPAEIVVTGQRRKTKAVDQLKLGSEHLDRCSSIVFDRKAKRISLSCV